MLTPEGLFISIEHEMLTSKVQLMSAKLKCEPINVKSSVQNHETLTP